MIKIELSDWLYNAGVVGVYNVLKHANIEVKREENAIIFEEESLDDFGEKYFGYLTARYEKFTSWYTIVSAKSQLEGFNQNNFTNEKLEFLNKQIEYIKEKCKSNSYKSAYELADNTGFDAENETKQLKKIAFKKDQELKDVWLLVETTISQYLKVVDYLEIPKVKRYVLAKNVMYDVVQHFWENVSFLHKTANKKDMYQLATEDFGKSVKDYLTKSDEKNKYQCMQCNRPMSKLSKPTAYDITWLKRIGVDMGRKSSHFWNYSADSYICPICYLVYACVPVGFTILKGQGIFINDNSSMRRLITINALGLDKGKSIDELEQENYYNLANILKNEEIKNADKQISNIQIVRYDSQNTRRPYTFNMLSKEKLIALTWVEKSLGKIINIRVPVVKDEYINVYHEVIENIYSNRNQFSLIAKLIYLLLDGKTKRTQVIYEILMINNCFIGGGGKMSNYKQIEECREKGVELRRAYIKEKAENKIIGMSHKLLNALKTKNTARFTETLLHAYMYIRQGVPRVFLEALKDEEKLQTIGYAFLLGLQSEKGTIKEELGNE